jgi:hypothetical protein
MQCMTVEPFTSAVLVANVNRVSSLCGIHQKPTLLTRGEGNSVGSQAAGGTSMQGPNRERWEELCRQAAEEQDPKRLLELTLEINRLLLEKRIDLATHARPCRSHLMTPAERNCDQMCANSASLMMKQYNSN